MVDTEPVVFTDSMIEEFVSSAQEDFFIGVCFKGNKKVYTYIAPSTVKIGSAVRVPGNSYYPNPQIARVVTLSPRVYPGPIVRVLEVLT